MQRIYWDAVNVNGRKVFYTVTRQGLNFVSSPEMGVSQILEFYPLTQFEYVHVHRETDYYRKTLKKYLKGKQDHFGFEIDINGTSQQAVIWNRIMQIPYGETFKLVDLADELHLSVTTVAQAMKLCPVWLAVPMHRVIERGNETGFRTDAEMAKYLREIEKNSKAEFK